jgi:hypothetical protein
VKDAQRHGQRFRPVDILRPITAALSNPMAKSKYVRLGLNYVKGLNAATAKPL